LLNVRRLVLIKDVLATIHVRQITLHFPLISWPRYLACRSCRLVPRTNIAPTQAAAVVRSSGKPAGLIFFAGGLCRHGQKNFCRQPMINARSESLPDKPAFRNASGSGDVLSRFRFFTNGNWKVPQIPYYIRLSDACPWVLPLSGKPGKPRKFFSGDFCDPDNVGKPADSSHTRPDAVICIRYLCLWLDKEVINPKQYSPVSAISRRSSDPPSVSTLSTALETTIQLHRATPS